MSVVARDRRRECQNAARSPAVCTPTARRATHKLGPVCRRRRRRRCSSSAANIDIHIHRLPIANSSCPQPRPLASGRFGACNPASGCRRLALEPSGGDPFLLPPPLCLTATCDAVPRSNAANFLLPVCIKAASSAARNEAALERGQLGDVAERRPRAWWARGPDHDPADRWALGGAANSANLHNAHSVRELGAPQSSCLSGGDSKLERSLAHRAPQ